MRPTPAANSDRPEFGIAVVEDGDAVTLLFNLDQISSFRTKFGDRVFVEVATRYVEARAEALSAHEELWLWKDAVIAHVMVPAGGGNGDDDGKA
ncbi:hypothetical protein [Phyllobacterium chamaecytisi]|uniref:hypothetical protein n=1 Tax=Phyllobacterium chamaecytisi TaxID=2876082 RepID=UPI001CCF3116|nr:hypothetical protein [Phyllobacterium sp. KW56]MBZ9602983.1 hypothetical protein [Phyllobacterium sp. KW56]